MNQPCAFPQNSAAILCADDMHDSRSWGYLEWKNQIFSNRYNNYKLTQKFEI